MKQVRPDGVLIESPIPSPHQSPNHILDRVKGDGMESRWKEEEEAGMLQDGWMALREKVQGY